MGMEFLERESVVPIITGTVMAPVNGQGLEDLQSNPLFMYMLRLLFSVSSSINASWVRCTKPIVSMGNCANQSALSIPIIIY